MARTKASVGAKVSSGKSSKARCSVAPPSSSSSSSGSSNRSGHSVSGGGGNSVCPQPTPKWQKSITNFFISKEPQGSNGDIDNGAGSSRPKKRNTIESDDEEITETTPEPKLNEEQPKNSVLDESIELAPLRGENSHKIEEYYQKNGLKQQNGETDENNPRSEEDHPKSGENLPKNGVKGKGRGKKTNKENILVSTNVEVERRQSLKRNVDEISEDTDHVVSKKMKVNESFPETAVN